MWVRFLADFDWKPRPPVTIALKAGDVKNVTRACAAAAVALGKAERTERPADARRQTSLEATLPTAHHRG
ncbi:hypothetical protein CN135_23610 [Sinorhizobium meliloti]|nr:hypothetical protein CN135_23610 [Sinorhizobium meliloti]